MNFTIKILRYLCCLVIIFLFTKSGTRYDYIESDVKAAFIINFTKYIDWQNDEFENDEFFIIGVIDDQSVYNSLKALESKKVFNKPIKLKFFANSNEVEKCHLFFIPNDLNVNKISSFAVSDECRFSLLISHKKNALNYGSSINFISNGQTLKFEISQNNLSKNKLKASSYLLNLAVNI